MVTKEDGDGGDSWVVHNSATATLTRSRARRGGAESAPGTRAVPTPPNPTEGPSWRWAR